ncbi:EAL domain-containing protein [Rhodobacter sp. TJ_12]|uniref:bifunctional diguanylate cyclase/phosphodiesterase n=1 Tax=Rhodobacter sp. TJ_12 TaxID=2029399 RepID=UPI001CBCBC76|nr:EAL domain-containing protein [Rhodobacter sp. TJ_12]
MDLLVRSMRLSAETVAEAVSADDLVHSGDDAIQTVTDENVGIAAVLIIDSTGHVVDGHYKNGTPVGLDLSDRPYFTRHRDGTWQGLYINAPLRARVDQTWSLPVSLPISTADGRFGGVVAVVAQEDYFSHLYRPFAAKDVQIYLRLHTDGRFVALPGPQGAPPLLTAVEAAIAQRPPQSSAPQPGTLRFDLPEAVATLSESPSGLFDVLVLRRHAALQAQARNVAVRGGFGVFLGAAFLALAGLSLVRWANAARTEAERARFLGERLRLATTAGGIGVWDYDIVNNHEVWDETMHRLYGLAPGSFSGTHAHWLRMVHPEDREQAVSAFRDAMQRGNDLSNEFRIVTPAGEIRVMATHARLFRDRNRKPVRAIGVNYDISERVAREHELQLARAEAEAARARIAHDALHDPLTGLANRRGMDDHLQRCLQTADPQTPMAYLHIDVDRFKAINDVFGHPAGDHLLSTVARLLAEAAPPGAKVARMGGDEFAVFLQGPRAARLAQACAEQFLKACREPVDYGGRKLWFSVSIGLSCHSAEAAESMVQNADIALYGAKNAGRDRIVPFSPELRLRVEETKRIADKLVDALRRDRLEVHFQPQVSAISHELMGVEALVRWRDPEDGMIRPDTFLPVAREMGLMGRIDALVLRKSIEAAHRLVARGLDLPRISVNVDLQRLMQPDLFDDLVDLHPLPCALSFELLETLDYDEITDSLLEVLARLRAMGIAIEIDDFGRGRTSLATLQRIRPDRLKIDRSLITQGGPTPEAIDPVVEAICNIGGALNIGLTAEGVEGPEQARVLARHGCDCLQGFYFARPMAEADLANWILQNHALKTA